MKQLRNPEDFDSLLDQPEAIIFKHSTACPISTSIHREVEDFLAQHPQQPLHKVHVIEDRPVSNYVSQKTGVGHASPQVIVLRNGAVAWHASHFAITAQALGEKAGRGRL